MMMASSKLYIGFSGCCDSRMPKRFLMVTRCLENLSSGENRAVLSRNKVRHLRIDLEVLLCAVSSSAYRDVRSL
jgi:hypothetical protein